MKRSHPSVIHKKVSRAIIIWLGALLIPLAAHGCGLDWTLPQAHFEGVEEHGYVAHWEKIGEIDLGNRVILPVHIGFNSRRETSSPVLGKGWIVALLESHVEPIDENAVNVIMPDGWTFLFLRNGNSETWRGNAGWAGETNDSIFTIKAPCGWKIKYDSGKIQEIDGSTTGALTYRYNGGVATEIDHEGTSVLQVENDPITGLATALIVGDKRIRISLAQRPRVMVVNARNLITGFDQSLASMQLPDGKRESFAFATDKALNPTLTLDGTGEAPRTMMWNATTRQVKYDGPWSYIMQDMGGHLRFSRASTSGETEIYEADDATGIVAEKSAGGTETVTYHFVSGPLAGRVRKIEQLDGAGQRTPLYSASYYPSGAVMREMFYPNETKIYSEDEQLFREMIWGRVVYEQDVDGQGRISRILDTINGLEVKRNYSADGRQTAEIFENGTLLYSEQIDHNNRLISINEGAK